MGISIKQLQDLQKSKSLLKIIIHVCKICRKVAFDMNPPTLTLKRTLKQETLPGRVPLRFPAFQPQDLYGCLFFIAAFKADCWTSSIDLTFPFNIADMVSI